MTDENDDVAVPHAEAPTLKRRSQDDNGAPLTQEASIYPEGGTKAWLTVFGAWCGMMGGLGLLNSVAPFQAYISTHQLRDYAASEVSWIFSIQAFIAFFAGIQIGPLFDAFGPRVLVLVGSVCLFTSMMVLGECTQYWHFVLTYSVLAGMGSSLLMTPTLASIGHFFNRRRAFATGLAMTGPSIGGVIFPLVFRAIYPRYGFAWATRALAFIILALMVFANIFIRSRLPRSKPNIRDILPNFGIFLDGDGALALCTAGLFSMELAVFIPLAYITSYCISVGLDAAFSYQVLAVINGASIIGRTIPGLIADKIGRYNTNAIMLVGCAVTNLAIWLPMTATSPPPPSTTVKAVIILYSVLFGITSGSNLALIGPCIGQLCETKHYGRYMTTAYVFNSFAALLGIPIAGALVNAAGGKYWGLTVFTGLVYALSAFFIAMVRVKKVGWKMRAMF